MSRDVRAAIRSLTLTASLGALALALPLGVSAQDPELQHHGDVPYVTGGVGEEEREAVHDLAQREGLDLQLVLTTPQGSFMSDVNVRIMDAEGELVLEVTSLGPWIFTTLPAGNYEVEADFPAGTLEDELVVEEGAQQVILTSPAD